MKRMVFAGGLGLGLLIGMVVPVWAQNETSRIAALEARIVALERRVSDPTTRKVEFAAADELRLSTGQSSLTMKKDGRVELRGTDIRILAQSIDVKETGGTVVKGSKIGDN